MSVTTVLEFLYHKFYVFFKKNKLIFLYKINILLCLIVLIYKNNFTIKKIILMYFHIKKP
jgi:hypothetical protein